MRYFTSICTPNCCKRYSKLPKHGKCANDKIKHLPFGLLYYPFKHIKWLSDWIPRETCYITPVFTLKTLTTIIERKKFRSCHKYVLFTWQVYTYLWWFAVTGSSSSVFWISLGIFRNSTLFSIIFGIGFKGRFILLESQSMRGFFPLMDAIKSSSNPKHTPSIGKWSDKSFIWKNVFFLRMKWIFVSVN